MEPNSQNQWWSMWKFSVRPGFPVRPPFAEVKTNCARFGRKAFGSASKMRVREFRNGYLVEVLTEGHPVHDPGFESFMLENWEKFFRAGFGQDTQVKMRARLMAGSPQDGTPSEQMLIFPLINLLGENNV